MDPTEHALLRLNIDLGVFLTGVEDDERRRLEAEWRAKNRYHG
jgi:hypothetical protein